MSEIQTTIDSISELIDILSTQCSNLNKDDNKDELLDIKQKIKKIENKLQLILPETKVQIPINGGGKLDKLKARAARFGALESNELKKSDESEKLTKRKERFGNSLETSSTNDAKRKRLERFADKS